MKRILSISTVLVFVFLQSEALAQRGGNHKERWEKYKSEKVAFLTTNLDLTPEEAQKFWPIYNQLDKKKSEAQMKRHELERKVREAGDSMSDDEIIKLTRSMAETMKTEGELNVKYNEEFLKILPPKKVLKLYKVEGEFRMHMFRKYREKRREENKCP